MLNTVNIENACANRAVVVLAQDECTIHTATVGAFKIRVKENILYIDCENEVEKLVEYTSIEHAKAVCREIYQQIDFFSSSKISFKMPKIDQVYEEVNGNICVGL